MSAVSPSLPMPEATPRWKLLTRWQAVAIHFSISLAVFMSLVLLMVYFWFPGDLFMLDGGWQGLKLVALIDLVLGPALTALLWSPKKKSLVFDMCVVGALQIAALAYGFVTTYDQRTVAMVFAEETFISVSNADHVEANHILREKEAEPVALADLHDGNPALVMTPPITKDTFGQYLQELFNGYPESSERSDQYMSLVDGREQMQASALDDEALIELGWLVPVQQTLKKQGKTDTDVELYRFKTRYAQGVVLFDPVTLSIVDYVPLEKQETPVAAAAMPVEEAAVENH